MHLLDLRWMVGMGLREMVKDLLTPFTFPHVILLSDAVYLSYITLSLSYYTPSAYAMVPFRFSLQDQLYYICFLDLILSFSLFGWEVERGVALWVSVQERQGLQMDPSIDPSSVMMVQVCSLPPWLRPMRRQPFGGVLSFTLHNELMCLSGLQCQTPLFILSLWMELVLPSLDIKIEPHARLPPEMGGTLLGTLTWSSCFFSNMDTSLSS